MTAIERHKNAAASKMNLMENNSKGLGIFHYILLYSSAQHVCQKRASDVRDSAGNICY
jgi:hypothetical protein